MVRMKMFYIVSLMSHVPFTVSGRGSLFVRGMCVNKAVPIGSPAGERDSVSARSARRGRGVVSYVARRARHSLTSGRSPVYTLISLSRSVSLSSHSHAASHSLSRKRQVMIYIYVAKK